jgi:lysyl-tRNA synthetase class 2
MQLTARLSALVSTTALPSMAAAATGGAIVLALVSGHGGGPLATAPGPPTGVPHLLAGGCAAVLVLLAHALWRGSRRAAVLAGLALAALAVAGLASGRHLVSVLGPLSGVATLALARGSFRTGAAQRGTRTPALVGAAALGGALTIATVSVLSADRVHNVVAAIGAGGVSLWNGGWWMRSDSVTAVGLDLLSVVAVGSAAMYVRRLLGPAAAADGHTADEHARAAAIVAAHATDSLAPFALREDKSFYFAHGGMLAYRALRGTAVVSGDPIGPPGSAAAILDGFEREAAARGWDVVVTGAGERELDAYRRLGFKTVCIGEEAVVDPAAFSLAGRANKALRHAVTRQARRGWTIETALGSELTAAMITDLAAADAAWRAGRPRLTGFAMTLGRLWGAEEDRASLYVIGRDPAGQVSAFLRFARYRDGLSLDAMRRVGEAPNGLVDTLVVRAIEHAREQAMPAVSLNFAGFGHVMGDDRRLSRGQSVARWLLRRTHGRFQLERLVTFNKKFAPRWERRYLVHRRAQRLPVLGWRVLQAEAYVHTPRTRALTARWEPRAQPVDAYAPATPPLS